MVAQQSAATERGTVVRGRGYLSNRSMSVNAAIAYENGERPISKWRKDDILNGLGRELVAVLNLDRYPAAFLKEMFLEPVAWHHTSRHYNVTDFYALRQTGSIPQEQALLASRYPEWMEEQARVKAAKAVREEPVKALVRYLVWPKSGGRKKRPVAREEYAILLPPFAYLASGTRKRLDGSRFEVVRRFESTPNGAGEVFAFIESHLPRK